MHKDPKRHVRHIVTWGYSSATQRILFPDLASNFLTACAESDSVLLDGSNARIPAEPFQLAAQ